MQKTLSIMPKLLMTIAAAGCSLIGLAASRPAAAQSYTVTELKPIAGGTFSRAYGINASGQVVGKSEIAGGNVRAVRWDGTTPTDLGVLVNYAHSSCGYGINSSGQVAGAAKNPGDTYHAAFFGISNSDIGFTGQYSRANGINTSGQVVGVADGVTDWGGQHAFLWQDANADGVAAQNEVQILEWVLGGLYSEARAINSTGVVVGWADLSNSLISHAFLHDASGSVDLGTLGGSYSDAYSINDSQQVVGEAQDASGNYRAFLRCYSWKSKSWYLKNLGMLPGFTARSVAYSINAGGQVVGKASLFINGDAVYDSDRAVLFTDKGPKNLNTMIPARASGWTLLEARGINDAGKIVGIGKHKGQYRAFLLTPK